MKMKKLLIKNMIAFAAILSLGSCDKKLDLYPYDSIELSQSFQTVKDAATWNTGLYADLRGRVYGSYNISQDVQADQLNATLDFGNRNGNPHRWGTSFLADDGALSGAWAGYYGALRNINTCIAGFEKVKTNNATEIATLAKYKGDAYLARAYYYSELILRFAKPFEPATAATDLGVPLVLEFDINARPARSTVKKVYDQIIADINTAKLNLASTAGAAGATKFTIDVALALEARVRLHMQDWAGAMTAANTIITGGKYPLLNTLTNLNNMWTNDLATEVIYQCAVVKQTEQANTNSIYLGFNGATGKYVPDFIPTVNFVNLYDAADFRKQVYLKQLPCIIQGVNFPTMWCVNKFPGNPALFTSTYTNYQHAPKVFRSAEMYLIYAEAAAKVGGASEALALTALNTLRTARGLTALSGLTGSALMTEIRNERTRELAFEGFRLFDLKRWHLGFTRGTAQDLGAINVGSNYNTINIVADANQFVWGIPTYDININTNLVQNPGW
ncbi:MAG: hypothetical protein RL034_588 [Bacteroidota bacterium]|jgi:hypothetical protein